MKNRRNERDQRERERLEKERERERELRTYSNGMEENTWEAYEERWIREKERKREIKKWIGQRINIFIWKVNFVATRKFYTYRFFRYILVKGSVLKRSVQKKKIRKILKVYEDLYYSLFLSLFDVGSHGRCKGKVKEAGFIYHIYIYRQNESIIIFGYKNKFLLVSFRTTKRDQCLLPTNNNDFIKVINCLASLYLFKDR